MIQQKKTISVPQNLISYSNELYHYGTKRHSGRYPWGSGDRPFQGDPAKRKEIRKEKLREFGQKAKSAAKIAGRIAGRAALSAGVSVLTTNITGQVMLTSLSNSVLKTIEQRGRDFLNNNADLSYKLFSTDAGDALLKLGNRLSSNRANLGTYGEKGEASRQMRIYAQKAGQTYMNDWERRYGKDFPN